FLRRWVESFHQMWWGAVGKVLYVAYYQYLRRAKRAGAKNDMYPGRKIFSHFVAEGGGGGGGTPPPLPAAAPPPGGAGGGPPPSGTPSRNPLSRRGRGGPPPPVQGSATAYAATHCIISQMTYRFVVCSVVFWASVLGEFQMR